MATTLPIILKELILPFMQVIPLPSLDFLLVAPFQYLNCSMEHARFYLKDLTIDAIIYQVPFLKLATSIKVMVQAQAKEVTKLEF